MKNIFKRNNAKKLLVASLALAAMMAFGSLSVYGHSLNGWPDGVRLERVVYTVHSVLPEPTRPTLAITTHSWAFNFIFGR